MWRRFGDVGGNGAVSSRHIGFVVPGASKPQIAAYGFVALDPAGVCLAGCKGDIVLTRVTPSSQETTCGVQNSGLVPDFSASRKPRTVALHAGFNHSNDRVSWTERSRKREVREWAAWTRMRESLSSGYFWIMLTHHPNPNDTGRLFPSRRLVSALSPTQTPKSFPLPLQIHK